MEQKKAAIVADVKNPPSPPPAKADLPRGFIAEWTVTIILLLFGTTTLVQAFVIPTGSMEDTLLIGDHYVAQAVECTGCGHLDAHLVSSCPICDRETREVVDVAEAILPRVIHQDIELFYVKDNPELDGVGNIAALLRFRSEGNNVRPIDEGADRRSLGRQPGLVGRYRGLATG